MNKAEAFIRLMKVIATEYSYECYTCPFRQKEYDQWSADHNWQYDPNNIGPGKHRLCSQRGPGYKMPCQMVVDMWEEFLKLQEWTDVEIPDAVRIKITPKPVVGGEIIRRVHVEEEESEYGE